MDQSPKQQIAEKLRDSSNVLIAVSKSPTVDQLAAAMGLSLMLSELGKHATAVFSGQIPDTMQFLDPQKQFETSVDGLRDFIISLDKDKADKLRYKVEDEVVKIFITPYQGQISEKDLRFSQGDFNVDVVVALGVNKRDDLDSAITNHGRILHDATIMTIEAGPEQEGLGTIHWNDPQASSISEMLVGISESLQGNLIDQAMATALLTGIVSATERFSNEKTTPKVMTMSAQLMAAGANQQLIAHNLQLDKPKESEQAPAKSEVIEEPTQSEESSDNGLTISHQEKTNSEPEKLNQEVAAEDALAQAAAELASHKSENTQLEVTRQDVKPEEPKPELKISPDGKIEHHAPEAQQSISHQDDAKPEPSISPQATIADATPEASSVQPAKSLTELENEIGAHQDRSDNSYINPSPTHKRIEPLKNQEAEKPGIGGTFNATSDEAQRAKEIEQNLNKTILSHDPKPAPEPAPEPEQQVAPEPAQSDEAADREKELEAARRALEAAAAGALPQKPQAKESTASTPMNDQGSGEIHIDNSGNFNFPSQNQPSQPPQQQTPPPPSAPPVPPPMPKPPQNQ